MNCEIDYVHVSSTDFGLLINKICNHILMGYVPLGDVKTEYEVVDDTAHISLYNLNMRKVTPLIKENNNQNNIQPGATRAH